MIFFFSYEKIGAQESSTSTFADAIRDTPATVVEALICFFSIWSVLGLWGYHTYLICRSVTTNEDVSLLFFFSFNDYLIFNFLIINKIKD